MKEVMCAFCNSNTTLICIILSLLELRSWVNKTIMSRTHTDKNSDSFSAGAMAIIPFKDKSYSGSLPV